MKCRKHAKKFKEEETQTDMTGRNCIVTGANQGIGYAAAEALASRYKGQYRFAVIRSFSCSLYILELSAPTHCFLTKRWNTQASLCGYCWLLNTDVVPLVPLVLQNHYPISESFAEVRTSTWFAVTRPGGRKLYQT
jgi:hypothetical protein